MVRVKSIKLEDNFLVIEYISNGIEVSNRIYNFLNKDIEQIVREAYMGLQPHINAELNRLDMLANHTFQDISNDVKNQFNDIMEKLEEEAFMGVQDYGFSEEDVENLKNGITFFKELDAINEKIKSLSEDLECISAKTLENELVLADIICIQLGVV